MNLLLCLVWVIGFEPTLPWAHDRCAQLAVPARPFAPENDPLDRFPLRGGTHPLNPIVFYAKRTEQSVCP